MDTKEQMEESKTKAGSIQYVPKRIYRNESTGEIKSRPWKDKSQQNQHIRRMNRTDDEILKIQQKRYPDYGKMCAGSCGLVKFLLEFGKNASLSSSSSSSSSSSTATEASSTIESDKTTVASCDLLMPLMGELIGSSMREYREDVLRAEMKRRKMKAEPLEWYIQLRRDGSCRTGGAGLGFDRLVNICCSNDGNIRDVVPFPVAHGECYY